MTTKGVYYTYNFIETGDEAGGVGWPWGADKLDDVNLQLKVRPKVLPSLAYTDMFSTSGLPKRLQNHIA